ncbi:MAG: aldo/keto reductase [Gemmatimonadota bacterium]|jgi:aryl-alcohol dehydrogenase-like predicted oxidoreductase|nr:aldo/keto reductase [Gemmatimonadota bacterium]MDP6803010.1 aldo/keto reductase [Gemmatimonadota bacterium]MDP7032273.1 aldo/keto reductase [Gemmatimonadota bacterium]
MRYRSLGEHPIEVSEVGLGTWQAGGSILLGGAPTGYGAVPRSEAKRGIERALDAGVNFFDTADSYGLGRAERILGEVVGPRRGQVVLATKCGWVPDGIERWTKDLSREHIHAAARRSATRLRVDTLDLLQLHAIPDEGAETDRALDALDELKASGLIRLGGVSVGTDYEAGVRLLGSGRVDVVQATFNLLQQGALTELLPAALEHRVAVIASIPLAYGFLSGRYTRKTEFPPDDWRSSLTREEVEARVARAEEFRFLSTDGGRTLMEAALLFTLSHPAVAATIPGFRSPEQVDGLVGSLRTPALTDIEIARARELGRSRTAGAPVPG